MLINIDNKAVGIFLCIFLISPILISCDSDSNNSSDAKTVFTENDFLEDFNLEADARVDTCVTFLEPPDDAGTIDESSRVSDGVNGTDVMRIAIDWASNLRICWIDDNEFAEHDVKLVDLQGNEILFHIANEECVTEMVEEGSYDLIFTHDGITDNTHSIYVRPVAEGNSGNGNLINLLITTDACEECFLAQGDFENADLSKNNLHSADLSGAILTKTNLYQAIIDNADLKNADLSFALAPNGAKLPANSIGFSGLNPGPGHNITFINQCDQSIWVAAVFGSPIKPFPPNGPPLWDGCDSTGKNCSSPSWEIPAKQQRQLEVPYGYENGQFGFRTGCTQSGSNLKCLTAGCGNNLQCASTDKQGISDSTTIEMTLDQPSGDNYNSSMVPAYHLIAEIKPLNPPQQPPARCRTVGVCNSLPTCPWGETLVRIDGDIAMRFRTSTANEIGVCLAPDKMIGNSALADVNNPFDNIVKDSQTDWKLRCSCPTVGNCAVAGCEGFYGCSPFTPKPPNPGEYGGCIMTFGKNQACQVSNCNDRINLPAPQGYSSNQICDPYGQCDKDLNRNAKWPDEALKYIESINTVCPTYDSNSVTASPYAWAFDDPKLPGLSGALGTCGSPGDGINYEVTLKCN